MHDTMLNEDQAYMKRSLVGLLIIFILGILCLQAFNLVFVEIGEALGSPRQASLITAIPGIILGIVCFAYGSLGDFVSLRKMVLAGVATLFVGSIGGFLFHSSIWEVVAFRGLQTAGAQVAGSVYLVLCAKYLEDSQKVLFFGIFTAGYQLSTAIGVLAAGWLTSINWAYLFLIPVIAPLLLLLILPGLPQRDMQSVSIDWIGFGIFGGAVSLLTLFFSSYNYLMLALSAVLAIIFVVYIKHAQEPFIRPQFFANKRWLKAILLVFVFYFVNYVIAPLSLGVGTQIYGLNAAQVSYFLLPCYVIGTVVATSSGALVSWLGVARSIIVAASCLLLGFLGAAFATGISMMLLTAALCVAYVGFGLLFSPLVNTVLSCVDPAEMGRGIGMNDLIMNVTASIGISMFGTQMAQATVLPTALALAMYSKLFMVASAIATVGLAIYLVVKRSFEEA